MKNRQQGQVEAGPMVVEGSLPVSGGRRHVSRDLMKTKTSCAGVWGRRLRAERTVGPVGTSLVSVTSRGKARPGRTGVQRRGRGEVRKTHACLLIHLQNSCKIIYKAFFSFWTLLLLKRITKSTYRLDPQLARPPSHPRAADSGQPWSWKLRATSSGKIETQMNICKIMPLH